MTKENFCTKLVFEGMEIDVSRRMLYRGKKEVKVTSVEFQILHLLARNPGRVFSKEPDIRHCVERALFRRLQYCYEPH